MSALSILDISAVRAAPVSREPYAYTLGSNVLKPDAIDDIRRDPQGTLGKSGGRELEIPQ